MRYVSVCGNSECTIKQTRCCHDSERLLLNGVSEVAAQRVSDMSLLSHSLVLRVLGRYLLLYYIHLFINDFLAFHIANSHSCLRWFGNGNGSPAFDVELFVLKRASWDLSATEEWLQKVILLQAQALWGHLQCSRISLVKYIPA